MDIITFFSKNIHLNIPIVTAAMDTVTEATMAIAIAQEGGIGVIHKNMTIEEQANQVRKVKRAENGMILDPITLHEDARVKDALMLMKEYGIGGIPVVRQNHELVGIVTHRDLRFEHDLDRPVAEVMTKDVITTTPFALIPDAARTLLRNRIGALPVLEGGALVGVISQTDVLEALTSAAEAHAVERVA